MKKSSNKLTLLRELVVLGTSKYHLWTCFGV